LQPTRWGERGRDVDAALVFDADPADPFVEFDELAARRERRPWLLSSDLASEPRSRASNAAFTAASFAWAPTTERKTSHAWLIASLAAVNAATVRSRSRRRAWAVNCRWQATSTASGSSRSARSSRSL
jgi:hypothetical protein